MHAERSYCNVKNVENIYPEDFIRQVNVSKSDICVIHVNIRSITRHKDDLLVLLKEINYVADIIILSECWLREIQSININGFDSYSSNIMNNKSSGVIVYIKSGLFKVKLLSYDAKGTCDNVFFCLSLG